MRRTQCRTSSLHTASQTSQLASRDRPGSADPRISSSACSVESRRRCSVLAADRIELLRERYTSCTSERSRRTDTSPPPRHDLRTFRRLGFTTIQLMPIDVTSGAPGWSYDQTRTGAVDAEAYGGAAGLIAFVERAHALGLEVIIDKQYNHRGPEQDSRGELIEGMFTRATKWGPGLSGREAPCYSQIVKLIGEELAYWALHFGADGFRLDATNRMPWELHEDVARLGAELATETGKSLYLLSEYAESEEPVGRRVPTGRQYADQPVGC